MRLRAPLALAVACIGLVASAGAAALAVGGETPGETSAGQVATPRATSNEILVGSLTDRNAHLLFRVYEYDIEQGLCTRVARYTLPDKHTSDGELGQCGLASLTGAVSMRAGILEDKLILYPRLSARVARVAVDNGAGGVKTAYAKDVRGRRERIAMLVLPAPALEPGTSAPTLGAGAAKLRVLAYDRAGHLLARVPVF
jgi:hypothetical protein